MVIASSKRYMDIVSLNLVKKNYFHLSIYTLAIFSIFLRRKFSRSRSHAIPRTINGLFKHND